MPAGYATYIALDAPSAVWGEWSQRGPTTGYDYLTMAGIALYYEHSHDPAAL